MRFAQPSHRRLAATWAALMALTIASMASGRVADPAMPALGIGWVAVILAVTSFKAVQVLRIYLNLRASTPGWRGAFYAILALICALVLAAYTAAALT